MGTLTKDHSFNCHHTRPQKEWDVHPLLPSRRASPHFGR